MDFEKLSNYACLQGLQQSERIACKLKRWNNKARKMIAMHFNNVMPVPPVRLRSEIKSAGKGRIALGTYSSRANEITLYGSPTGKTLLHELIHCYLYYLGKPSGHTIEFWSIATRLGLYPAKYERVGEMEVNLNNYNVEIFCQFRQKLVAKGIEKPDEIEVIAEISNALLPFKKPEKYVFFSFLHEYYEQCLLTGDM